MTEDKQKIVRTILIIIVVLIAGYFLYQKSSFLKKELKPKEAIPKNVVTPQITRTVENNLQKETPQGFPKSILLNGKTKIIESYSATYPNSTIKQSTISFESSKTTKENYDFYEKWAGKNNFKIINKTNKEPNLFLYARKQQDNKTIDLNIAIVKSEKDNKFSKINISYAEI